VLEDFPPTFESDKSATVINYLRCGCASCKSALAGLVEFHSEDGQRKIAECRAWLDESAEKWKAITRETRRREELWTLLRHERAVRVVVEALQLADADMREWRRAGAVRTRSQDMQD